MEATLLFMTDLEVINCHFCNNSLVTESQPWFTMGEDKTKTQMQEGRITGSHTEGWFLYLLSKQFISCISNTVW